MELQTVNQVSRSTGISAQMLRYYERCGLITSQRKMDYAYRLYDDENIKRIQQIIILRKLQIPVKQIAVILNNPDAAFLCCLTDVNNNSSLFLPPPYGISTTPSL
jgi:DNA-binding transcriptional MerR regulator